MMREKTEVVQPQIDTLKENVKLAKTQEEKLEANKLLMDTYKQYDINPLKNMIGCLPILIQLPILCSGLFFPNFSKCHSLPKRSAKNALCFNDTISHIYHLYFVTICFRFRTLLDSRWFILNHTNAFCTCILWQNCTQ